METTRDLIELTVRVVTSFASHNTIAAAELPALIQATHAALSGLSPERCCSRPHKAPAVPVDRSITRDYIVCLDDGRHLKTLKRYLRRKYSLTPEQYRARWNLKPDHPITAPGYSERRSAMAKQIGLGRGRGALAERKGMHETKTVTTPQPSPKRRGRPRSSDLDRTGVDPTQHDRGGGG